MKRLTCKTCGSKGMMPMDVVLEEGDHEPTFLNGEQESRFFTCHVCGDNWLSVKETNLGGDCRVTFIHQMGMSPVLKRIAYMHTPVLVKQDMVEDWEYYMGEDAVSKEDWHDRLDSRRETLRCICMN